MSSKQSQLRNLMKIERQRKNITSGSNETTTKSQPKSILKSKPSYASNKSDSKPSTTFSDNLNDVKIEIVKKKRTKVKKVTHSTDEGTSKPKSKVDFNAIERDELAKEAAANSSGDAEQDFEDFLNEVDEIEVEESNVRASSESNDGAGTKKADDTKPPREESLDNNDSDRILDESKQQEQEMEMEQSAYEARLAKLMLLSRKRKSKDLDDTVIDFTPQLAFQDSSTTFKNSKGSFKDDSNLKEKSDGSSSADLKVQKPSNSIKDLLRKKRSKKAKVSANFGVMEDDSFWS